MRPNVRTADTGITHEHVNAARQLTRCGLRYVRNCQYVLANDPSPVAHETEAEVDCMACVAKEAEHEALLETIVADSVKDMTEAEDARAARVLEDP